MKYVWVFADYKQAEAMVVAWRGPIPTMKTWFIEGRDTHLESAKLIAKAVQDHKIKLPKNLFNRKPWQELTKSDSEERDIGKQGNHANNYGLGKVKFSQITGLPVQYADLLQKLHHSIFPEIKSGYQKWIESQIDSSRTLWTPLGRRRIFYDIIGPDLYRAGYAFYPQSTVGDLLVRTLVRCAEIFKETLPEAKVVTPYEIAKWGLDIQLQVHDSIGVVVPDDSEVIEYTCKVIKKEGEYPLLIGSDPLTIPLDFKVGTSWGDAKDYEVA